ncbi:MAG: hypothetical protein AAGM27_05230 [Cyanobacteria bacterium J06554_3]
MAVPKPLMPLMPPMPLIPLMPPIESLKAVLEVAMKKLRLLCFALLLTLLTTSCGLIAQTPPNSAVLHAIVQQQVDMQTAVAEGLQMSTRTNGIPDFQVGKVYIENREKLSDPDLKKQAAAHGAYVTDLFKVTGTYDATLTKGGQTIEQNSPFEVYMGNRPKSMRSTVSAAEAVEIWYLLAPDSAKAL